MNVSNNDNLATDSGYKFYNILAEEIIAADHDLTFVGPAPLESPSAKYKQINYGSNKYEFRFLFDMERVSNIIMNSNPDIIIVNQIELIPHFYICLEKLGNTTAKIVGYAHYIPFSIDSDGFIAVDNSLNARQINTAIIHAFFSGLEMAECVFVHSETAIETILTGCKQLGRNLNKQKFVIAPPPKDPLLADEKYSVNASGRHIIYNHRLYAHYGTEYFIQLIPFLTSLNTHVTVLDILGKRSPERKSMDASPDLLRQKLLNIPNVNVIDGGAYGDSYREILKTARFGLAPYRINCSWSMSCIDLMSVGKPVIAPNMAWFKEFIPAPLLFKNPQQARTLSMRLLDDERFYSEMSLLSYEKTKSLEPKAIADIFLNTLINLIDKEYVEKQNRLDLSIQRS